MKIKTWTERCDDHPDHQTGMISHSMIQARMQEEIEDLRELAAARALLADVMTDYSGIMDDEQNQLLFRIRAFLKGQK